MSPKEAEQKLQLLQQKKKKYSQGCKRKKQWWWFAAEGLVREKIKSTQYLVLRPIQGLFVI